VTGIVSEMAYYNSYPNDPQRGFGTCPLTDWSWSSAFTSIGWHAISLTPRVLATDQGAARTMVKLWLTGHVLAAHNGHSQTR
jgi:hypothetical protein